MFLLLYGFLCGTPDDPTYYDIFLSVGLITLLISVGICAFFYLVLGRWKSIWYTLIHWVITFIITGLLCFGFAYSQAKSQIGAVDGYLIRFAIINSVYAIIYFIAFSFLLKNFSIYSKRTPI